MKIFTRILHIHNYKVYNRKCWQDGLVLRDVTRVSLTTWVQTYCGRRRPTLKVFLRSPRACCTCLCLCMCVCVYLCACACMCACICVCARVCVCEHVCACVHACVCACICVCESLKWKNFYSKISAHFQWEWLMQRLRTDQKCGDAENKWLLSAGP